MKFDRDKILLEMHADIREIRTRIEVIDSLKTKVDTIEKRMTWLQGVGAAMATLFTAALTFGKYFYRDN